MDLEARFRFINWLFDIRGELRMRNPKQSELGLTFIVQNVYAEIIGAIMSPGARRRD